MKLSDFDYNLPEELIAQEAVKPKDSSKLMVVNKDFVEHKHFYDLIDYLEKDDVLVINETKVSKAKICGKKITGSDVEVILCEKINDYEFISRIKVNNVNPGNKYVFNKGLECEVIGQYGEVFKIKFNKKIDNKLLDEQFELPLPNYVKRKVTDETEYQTVYSKQEGSLAAPTAGLHFTEELLKKIEEKGVKIARVCLHIDFGTFLPVRGEIQDHKMHKEYFEISEDDADIINNGKGMLVLVGTTSVRALESAANSDGKIVPQKSNTEIFIYPGYDFKVKFDALITNFHLPKSTLLMLVSAYYGREKVLEVYEEAVKEKYRFYSLGDSMVLVK
ncbi:tRNA preQ1(34) S-adenosylmethionine ribosyltransferase-isomerase QueA [Nanoarchaeota archaeon]